MPHFERRQPIIRIAAEAQPSAIGIINVHHFLPNPHRQTVLRFFVPGDLRHLQFALRVAIENAAAEQQRQRHFAIFKAVKVFRRRDIEIERARNRQIDDRHAGKRRHDRADVRPQHRAQRLPPAIRLAKQIAAALPDPRANSAAACFRFAPGSARRCSESNSAGSAFVIRSLKFNSGETACASTSVPSIWKFRSGMMILFDAMAI